MAKIQKIDLNVGHRIINPFKTTRNSTTNPFKYQNFEGNTIDVSLCADIFEGTAQKTNKMKLISSSVIGSVSKFRNSITESISNFVKRIGIADGIKNISELLNKDIVDIGKDIKLSVSDSLAGIGNNIKERMSVLNSDITGLGKDISALWISMTEKIHHKKNLKELSVAELRTMLEEELALTKEAA